MISQRFLHCVLTASGKRYYIIMLYVVFVPFSSKRRIKKATFGSKARECCRDIQSIQLEINAFAFNERKSFNQWVDELQENITNMANGCFNDKIAQSSLNTK